MQLTSGLRRAAHLHGALPATDHAGRRHTWAEFADRVTRLAGGLGSLGLQPGSRVAILAHNSDRYLEAMYGTLWAGAIMVPLNARLSRPELQHCLADSAASVLIASNAFLPLARELASEGGAVRALVAMDDGPLGAGETGWTALLAASPIDDRAGDGAAVAGIFYTGGTTGKAKGVMLSHANLLINVLNLMPWFRFSEKSRCLHASPMFHIADSLSIFGVTLCAGQHFFVPKFDTSSVLRTISDQHITYAAFVPTMLKMLIEAPDFASHDLSSIETVFYGGSPIPETVLRKAVSAFPRVRFHQGYGLTETSPTITHLPPERHVFDGALSGKTRSAGQPVMTAEISIRDTGDRPMAVGQPGEICVRGPNVMLGYWNNPAATTDALQGGWFRTGDFGYLDTEGFLYVVDRIKDMIVSGGENVFSTEVESVLLSHPAVLECAVIGLPDDRWGERVHAIIRFKPGHSASHEDLLAHCRRFLGGYKCPRSIAITDEALPLSGAGKVLKGELKKLALAS